MREKESAPKQKVELRNGLAIAFVILLAGFAVSELFAIPVLMMAASAALVLTALLAGSILPGLELVEYAKRRA